MRPGCISPHREGAGPAPLAPEIYGASSSLVAASASPPPRTLPPPESRLQDARAWSTCACWQCQPYRCEHSENFADQVGINSFAELRSGQGGGSGEEKRCPRSQTARHFENRSTRAQPLKSWSVRREHARAILKIEVARRARTVSARHEAAGRLTREPPPASRQKLDFLRAHSQSVLVFKIAGREEARPRRFVVEADIPDGCRCGETDKIVST